MKKYLPLLVALLGVARGVSLVPVQADDLCDIYLGTTAPEVWCTDNPTIVPHTTPCYPVEPPDASAPGCPEGTEAFRVVYVTGSTIDYDVCGEIPMAIYSFEAYYECFSTSKPSPRPVGYVTIKGSSRTSILIAKLFNGNEWVDPHYMSPESIEPPGPWSTQYILSPGKARFGLFERGEDKGQNPVWTTEVEVIPGKHQIIVVYDEELRLPIGP